MIGNTLSHQNYAIIEYVSLGGIISNVVEMVEVEGQNQNSSQVGDV